MKDANYTHEDIQKRIDEIEFRIREINYQIGLIIWWMVSTLIVVVSLVTLMLVIGITKLW